MVLGNVPDPRRPFDTSPRAPPPTLVLAFMPPALDGGGDHPHLKSSHCPMAAPLPAVPSGRRPVRPGPCFLNQAMRFALHAGHSCVTFSQAIATKSGDMPLKG